MSKTQWSAFWSSASQRGGAAAPGKTGSAGSGRWESIGAAEKRLRSKTRSRMKADKATHRAGWAEGRPGCRNCAGQFHVLKMPVCRQNAGYPYIAQCLGCLRSAQKGGWGEETSFTNYEDNEICELLNQHGMPVGQRGEPSVMHFHKSFLHFYFRFRRKKWVALSEHLRTHFTTTWSTPLAGVRHYRGWYNETSGSYPNRRGTNVAI
mgnify:CR=1 FL=1